MIFQAHVTKQLYIDSQHSFMCFPLCVHLVHVCDFYHLFISRNRKKGNFLPCLLFPLPHNVYMIYRIVFVFVECVKLKLVLALDH